MTPYDDDLGQEDDDLGQGDDELDQFDEVGAEGNRVVGAAARDVLEYVAKAIVDEPDGVFIESEERGGELTLRLHVAPSDVGRVIGRRGRVAQAIRQVVRTAGAREGTRTVVDIAD